MSLLICKHAFLCFQLAVEYENNAMIVKVDTDDEYEFARDMQVIVLVNNFASVITFY